MGRSESPDDRRRRRSRSRDEIDRSDRRRGSSHKRSDERRGSRRSRSGSRERRRSRPEGEEGPRGGRPGEGERERQNRGLEEPRRDDREAQRAIYAIRQGERERIMGKRKREVMLLPASNAGSLASRGALVALRMALWSKVFDEALKAMIWPLRIRKLPFGDGLTFGKGKGKGFSGGKGRWSGGGGGKGAGFVWKHDKFEEEMKAEEEEEAHEEPAEETADTTAHDHQESTKKPIKFDLYAEKLDDNVVQAVLDNVRERIDKRREVMQQRREERDAEVKKMIEAGENPFARKPREGPFGGGMSALRTSAALNLVVPFADERSGGWTRDGSGRWPARRGPLPPDNAGDTIERPRRQMSGGARSAPYGFREPERRQERERSGYQARSPLVERPHGSVEDARNRTKVTETGRAEDRTPRASRPEDNPREGRSRSEDDDRRRRSPLSRQHQHRGLKMEQQSATRDMAVGDRERERDRSPSESSRRARDRFAATPMLIVNRRLPPFSLGPCISNNISLALDFGAYHTRGVRLCWLSYKVHATGVVSLDERHVPPCLVTEDLPALSKKYRGDPPAALAGSQSGGSEAPAEMKVAVHPPADECTPLSPLATFSRVFRVAFVLSLGGMVMQLRASIISADSVTPTLGRQYVMYTVKLQLFEGPSGGVSDTWTVYRRYSAFSEADHKLHRLLLSAAESVQHALRLPELPPKTLLVPRLDPEFVAARREGLQQYLDNLLPFLLVMSPSMQNVVSEFLEVPLSLRNDLYNPPSSLVGQVPSSEFSGRSFGEHLHGPDSIDNSLHVTSPLRPVPVAGVEGKGEMTRKMTPDEEACAALGSFMEKLLEAQGESGPLTDEVADDSPSNDKVQIIRTFECWFAQNKPQYREPSIRVLFIGFDPTGQSYLYNENAAYPQYGDASTPVGLLPEVGSLSETPPVSACVALGFLRKLLSFEFNSEAGLYTHVLKTFPFTYLQGMRLEMHIRLNRGQSSRLDSFQIIRTISPPGDRLIDLLNGDEWAVQEYTTWLKILGSGPAVSGMIGGPPGVLVQRRTNVPRIMKSSIHGRQNSLSGRQSARRGTQAGGGSRGGLDLRKVAQEALLKVSTCVSTITYDDGTEESDPSTDNYHRLATNPPEHMARAKLLHLPYHPEYVGALVYDHKAFIDNVLELDTQGSLPKAVRDRLLEFSYTHYNPLLHNVMKLSLPSKRLDVPGDSAASPRNSSIPGMVASPSLGPVRSNNGTSSCPEVPSVMAELLDVVLNSPNSAPGFVKMQLLRAFKQLPPEDGGGYEVAYTSVDLSDELVSRAPGMWRGHVPFAAGPSPSVTLPTAPISPAIDRGASSGGQTYLFSSTLDCRTASLSPCGMTLQPCGDDGSSCDISAAAIFGLDSINLVSGDLLGEYIFFWPTLENFLYILQNLAPLLPAYPYEFHHPFIEWIYTGIGPDCASPRGSGTPKRPRASSGSPANSSDLGRFGGAGIELTMENIGFTMTDVASGSGDGPPSTPISTVFAVPSVPQLYSFHLGHGIAATDVDTGSYGHRLTCGPELQRDLYRFTHPGVLFKHPMKDAHLTLKGTRGECDGKVYLDANYSLNGSRILSRNHRPSGGPRPLMRSICTKPGSEENYRLYIAAHYVDGKKLDTSLDIHSDNMHVPQVPPRQMRPIIPKHLPPQWRVPFSLEDYNLFKWL
ncbi:hypothetical protein FOL47_003333 [Perkinsus chesapeaki]|uniref:PX domain-containing protein n=1 Tax=Perkinsus chesapeaki TaxID=330153 RepID=A0A7J6M9Q9_PERCH|nr:hypothetical protein FOL47_003333 [Perkinsus chesapeaki]